jgi:hypothetical protein
MTAPALLADLARRAIIVRRADDPSHLTVDAPEGALTATDVATIRSHKPALLALLAALEELERDGTAAKLRVIAEGLTAAEHERLRAEAAAGDPLAELITAVLATPLKVPVVLRCVCGGATWWPEPDGKAERCVECGAWSPVSMTMPRTGPAAGATEKDESR